MSGLDIITLIGTSIELVDTAHRLYESYSSANGLPVAFKEVADKLPLIAQILDAVKDKTTTRSNTEKMDNFTKNCNAKAENLKRIFEEIDPRGSPYKADRYLRVLRTIGKQKTVEALAKGLLEDLQLLTAQHLILEQQDPAELKDLCQQLDKALEDIEKLILSPSASNAVTQTHHGTGHNFNVGSIHDGQHNYGSGIANNYNETVIQQYGNVKGTDQ